jgi:spoIIIJ-associated protein
MADRVRTAGEPLSLEPMPANERRIVHITLKDDPDVYTESTGLEDKRRVVILPRK